jgi:hypothetical protein
MVFRGTQDNAKTVLCTRRARRARAVTRGRRSCGHAAERPPARRAGRAWTAAVHTDATPAGQRRFLSSEGCRFGDRCNFAHGDEEIRSRPDAGPAQRACAAAAGLARVSFCLGRPPESRCALTLRPCAARAAGFTGETSFGRGASQTQFSGARGAAWGAGGDSGGGPAPVRYACAGRCNTCLRSLRLRLCCAAPRRAGAQPAPARGCAPRRGKARRTAAAHWLTCSRATAVCGAAASFRSTLVAPRTGPRRATAAEHGVVAVAASASAAATVAAKVRAPRGTLSRLGSWRFADCGHVATQARRARCWERTPSCRLWCVRAAPGAQRMHVCSTPQLTWRRRVGVRLACTTGAA